MIRPFPLIQKLPNLPRKPCIPFVRAECKSMTIAAGFNCKDGVVLCSDTQITQAAGESYESKIFCIKAEADCHLAYAGYAEFIKEFVAELKEIISGLLGCPPFEYFRRQI